MLSKCANPECPAPFRKLREGKLFNVEVASPSSDKRPAESSQFRVREQRRVEFYWLCNQCATYLTLAYDRERGIITVPLPNKIAPASVGSVSMNAAISCSADLGDPPASSRRTVA